MYCQCNTKKNHMQQTISGNTYTVCSKRSGGCGNEYDPTKVAAKTLTTKIDNTDWSSYDLASVASQPMMGLGQQIQNRSLGSIPMPSNQQKVNPGYMHMPTKRTISTIRKMPGFGFNWEHHCGLCGFTGSHVDAFTYCPQCGDEF